MNKLTLDDIEKMNNNQAVMFVGGRVVGKQAFSKVMAEMLEYKRAEQHLGIDLITMSKAFKDGVWARGKVKRRIIQGSYYPIWKDAEVIEYVSPQEIAWDFGRNQLVLVWDYPVGTPKLFCNLKDYGKKGIGGWALTQEELEDK